MSLIAAVLTLTFLQVPKPVITELAPGSGVVAERGDVVSLGFRCTYLDGQIMDSTFGRSPLSIRLGWRPRLDSFARIPFAAFDDSVVGMKSGGKRKIVLPSSLAFGSLEVGDVPANSDLAFEVELYEVLKKGTSPTVKIENVRVGTGAEIAAGKSVAVHYRGKFLNDVEFDSSFKELDAKQEPIGDPMRFVYEQMPLVKGFDLGLKGMKVGGIRRVTVPYNLGYTDKGQREIPPYATLVFELRLMAVE